ncbi:hypothetical protein SELMODRAFT_22115, partial [Selaginella moellendorffii]
SFVTLLRQCVSSKNLGHGRRLHEQIVDAGFGGDILLQNLLIRMYGSCGCLEEAKAASSLFDQMPEKDLVAWTAMLTALADNDRLRDARILFDLLPEWDSAAWNVMIAAYAAAEDLEQSQLLFAALPIKNVISWTSIIAAHGACGEIDRARAIFRKIPARTAVSWTVMITALANLGHLDEARSVLEAMGHPDVLAYNLLLTAHLRYGSLEQTESLFDGMLERDVMPDHRGVPAWNVIISGHAQSGHAKLGLELFHRMLLHGLDPNRITLTSVLAACCHTGNSKSVHAFFLSMTSDFGILPVYDHFLCMASHLGRSGLVTHAEELLCSMPFEPDAIGWITLLDACVRHKDVKRGERAADVATKLSPGRTAPYILLSNLYAAVGDWAGVARVRTTMKELGI